jgi:lysophospholipase L1-like esterase
MALFLMYKALMKKSFKLYVILIAAIVVSSWMISPAGGIRNANIGGGSMKEEFEFINYDRNKISIEGEQDKWDKLFAKFENLAFNGQGKISIVHIGGSHVQGGFLTDKMRENFCQLVYGASGERGFVFPYKLANSNGPKTVKCDWTGKWTGCRNSVNDHECLWGMSGISATSYDSTASISLSSFTRDSIPYSFDKVRIYNQRSANVQIDADTNIRIIKIIEDPNAGYTEFIFTPSVTTLHFRFHRTDTEESFFTFQGAYLGDEKNGLIYNSIGVNGASTRSYLRCGLFEKQLETIKPDLAIFGIGVNDANVPEGDFNATLYEERYDSLVRQFLHVNPNACILFVTNNDTYYHKKHPNKNAILVQESMYRLAAKYNGAVYDLFEIMGGLGSIRKWQNADLAASDKIHLSKKGYELQADMMTFAFREAFGNYLDKKHTP